MTQKAQPLKVKKFLFLHVCT